MIRFALIAAALAFTATDASAQARRLQPPPTATDAAPFRPTTESPGRRAGATISGSVDGSISGRVRNSISGSAGGPVGAYRPEPGFKIR